MRKIGGRCVPFALVAALAAACSVSSGSRPDSGPGPGEDGGGPGTDGPVGAAGLVLEFRGVPTLSASLGGEFNAELEEVRLDLENVRAVGDAAPGDSRTTKGELQLEWSGETDDDGEGDANNEPVLVTFNEAPPGLYSNVFAELKEYRLAGTVEIEASGRDFEIQDSPDSLAISIPLGGVTLEAGETQRITIDVSCGAAVLATPWDAVGEEEGELVVTSGSEHIGVIRSAMQGAFAYDDDAEVTAGP